MDLLGDLTKLKVVDLKAELQARNLDTKGIKAVLISRLEAALLAEKNNAEETAKSSDLAEKADDNVSPEENQSSSSQNPPDPVQVVTAVAASEIPVNIDKTVCPVPEEKVEAVVAEEATPKQVISSQPVVQPAADEDVVMQEATDVENTNTKVTGDKRPAEDEASPVKKRASSVEPNDDDFTKEEDEPEIDESKFTLSWYDSDIHLKIDQVDFMRAKPISDAGLNLVWAGTRSNHGVKEGKVAYEVHLSNYNRTNHNQDEKKMHEFRCGWSTDNTSLQLGESQLSFGYDTNAKKCTDCKFEEYGKRYGLYDVVGVYLDLESTPCKIEYTLNGESLGTAFEFDKSVLEDRALFPHISTKNVGFVVNFGTVTPSLYSEVPSKTRNTRQNARERQKKKEEQKPEAVKKDENNEEDTNVSSNDLVKDDNNENTVQSSEKTENASEVKEEMETDAVQEDDETTKKSGSLDLLPSYIFINTIPANELVPGPRRPSSREECEIIMMIGLPGSGKTFWARNYIQQNPEKRYNAFGVAFLLEKMKVNGEPRKPNNSFKWSHMIESLSRSLNILHNIACRRRRNYIIDQPNVYANLQRRKMSRFGGFFRVAVIVFPTDENHKERSAKRLEQQGKEYSPANVEEMHAKFSLPALDHQWFKKIIYTDLQEDVAREAIKKINEEGAAAKSKRKEEREQRAKQRSRQYQGGNRNSGMWGQSMRNANWERRPGEGYGYGRPPREQWNANNWMRGSNNFRRGGMMPHYPQRRDDRRPGPGKGGNDQKRQKLDQGGWGGNWNSFGPGGFQQNNTWAQPVWSRGHQNANGSNFGGNNSWWQ